jgi:GNAT superfamily N-acetyltransferase
LLSLPEPLRLRAAANADQPFLDALYAGTRDDLASMPVEPALLDQLIKMQQQAQAQGLRHMYPHAAYFIVERDGVAIGRMVLDCADTQLRLLDLSLMPAARGQGSGGAILRALQALAAARGQPLALSVSLANPAARRLYALLGFVSTGADSVQESMEWRD